MQSKEAVTVRNSYREWALLKGSVNCKTLFSRWGKTSISCSMGKFSNKRSWGKM